MRGAGNLRLQQRIVCVSRSCSGQLFDPKFSHHLQDSKHNLVSLDLVHGGASVDPDQVSPPFQEEEPSVREGSCSQRGHECWPSERTAF